MYAIQAENVKFEHNVFTLLLQTPRVFIWFLNYYTVVYTCSKQTGINNPILAAQELNVPNRKGSSEHKPRLLIVEDEKAILEGLIDLFVFHGFEVDSSIDGGDGLNKATHNHYDCIILDVMLPTMNGFSLCNAIRQQSRDQAIIMLTAKNSEEDIINGLSMGADDYIAKPFSVRELVLRVNAILRRTGNALENEKFNLTPSLTIDPQSLSGLLDGNPILFTRREIDILLLLKHRAGRPISRQELLCKVWGYQESADIDTRTVDIHMAKLRKKIETDSKKPKILLTVRGEGYRLNDI